MKNKIIAIVLGIVACAATAVLMRQQMMKGIKYWYKLTMKNELLFRLSAQWAEMENEGKKISDRILQRGYKNVAIYGYGTLGEHLYNVLNKSEVCVKCVIDQKADEKMNLIEVCRPDEIHQDFDAMIVTAIGNYDEIKEEMETKVSCPIISLEDLVYEE